MSRTIRSTRSNRIAETFDRPSRGPLVLAAIVSVTLGALVACHEKSDKHVVDSGVIAKPDDSTLTAAPTIVGERPSSTVPENISFAVAESTYQDKRYKEATDMFQVYVARRPENPWGYYMLGLSAWKSGQLEVAADAFAKSIELDSSHVKSYLNLGRVRLDQGRAVDALEPITTATQLDSTSGEVFRMLGRVQSSLNQPDEAMDSYRIALSLEPTDVWSMNNLALLLIQQGRNDEAIPALARAVELRPGSPVFQNNLGIALERTGHFAAAGEAYKAALASDSTYTKASKSLARVTSLVDDPATQPVELKVLAQAFARDVALWKVERTAPVALKP